MSDRTVQVNRSWTTAPERTHSARKTSQGLYGDLDSWTDTGYLAEPGAARQPIRMRVEQEQRERKLHRTAPPVAPIEADITPATVERTRQVLQQLPAHEGDGDVIQVDFEPRPLKRPRP